MNNHFDELPFVLTRVCDCCVNVRRPPSSSLSSTHHQRGRVGRGDDLPPAESFSCRIFDSPAKRSSTKSLRVGLFHNEPVSSLPTRQKKRFVDVHHVAIASLAYAVRLLILDGLAVPTLLPKKVENP
jgi:hypothetical protein